MLLTVRDLTKTYGATPILRGVSLDLAAGQSLALTGESGSGKSTLLHLIGALDTPDSGTLMLDGHPLSGLTDSARAALRRTQIGMVFQQFNLIPSLTVAQNIALQSRLAGRVPDTAGLAKALGLSDLLARYPEQLSGGQQQRVAIARALAPSPPLVLADEPTGNLDEDTAAQVMELLLHCTKAQNAALLMVTHSPALAGRLDRRLHLSHGRLT